ncbi:Sec63 Brl domain-domain-containing protein [Kockovaella imperatae]|uniref:Sec63 Brl domain-domain-containing protein n=1 Tax=Kockovaella imperatae TaxID=4999 RepID=A0A1Y1U9E4_9TREE|nr:Sec63 Brl domain-domain-containing protein [Kockovaella imperatae]ORX34164.1 Sec63 Brl domain-domain-containing protein [Kockovaella imperatae]
MAPGISYDDSGSLASYFGVTFLAILLLPFTYSAIRPSKKATLKPLCPCSTCATRATQLASLDRGKRKRKFWRRIVPLVLGWSLFAFLCYRISQTPMMEGDKIYNPFEVLGISDSSTEKQIKKHYKKLSLLFHPDKIVLGPNQTQADADAKFVELTKAYKSLTDEVTRENLAKYGNPDGPQQREDKIAIPKWVVEGKSSIGVLAAYGLLLGGGIPLVVGRWWFSQRRMTRDGVLNGTAELFFHHLQEDTDFGSLVALLSCALELVPILAGGRRGSKKERKERQGRIDELEKELETKREDTFVFEDPNMRKENRVAPTTAVSRRASALLWAHLLRHDLKDTDLEEEQLAVLRALPTLFTALLNIALAHNWLATSLGVVQLQAALVQALPPSASPLAQLPGLEFEKAFELGVTSGSEGRKWAERATKKQIVDGKANQVLKYWPRLEITDAEFKVVGERVVTPSSIVNLTFRARYNYASTSIPTDTLPKPKVLANGDVKAEMSTDDDNTVANDSVTEVEDQLEKVDKEVEEKEASAENRDEKSPLVDGLTDAVTGTKEPRVGRQGKKPENKVYPPNGYAHAPRWPGLRKPNFQVLLGDSKLNKVIVQPIRITDLPLPRDDGLPSEPREFSLQFQAPPQANLYSFVLYAASDTFLGGNVEKPIMLKVEEPPLDNELSDDEDISDPEEDTLAGQMAMMRGAKVKASPVHGQANGDADEEEGSDSEYEYEYESSSDEEGPKGRKKAINEDSSDSD